MSTSAFHKPCLPVHSPGARRRRGYTMIEVLFALMVLGIGLVMIAGVFPVAVQQTQLTVASSKGVPIASSAIREMSAVFAPLNAPATTTVPGDGGMVFSLNDPRLGLAAGTQSALWSAAQGNMICTADPHYGWVGFYSRGLDSTNKPLPYVQLFAVAVASGAESVYVSPGDLAGSPFVPTLYSVTIDQTQSPPTISIGGLTAINGPIGENAYVLISDDGQSSANQVSKFNGMYARIGNRSGAANTWELQPGADLSNVLTGVNTFKAFIIGRQADPSSGTPTYTGPVQDLALVTGAAPVMNK
jgi:prepilin-type N-terminal cleavage/methylation domain-containing protein